MGKQRRHGVWLLSVVMVWVVASAGCLQTKMFVFDKRQGIAAPPAKIFSVVSDFQDYPRLFPDSHNKVTIVSQVKEGKGVVFDNVAVYSKDRLTKNRWTVTEFERDRLIRMDNDTAGSIIILLHQVDYDTTEATMIASVNIPPQLKVEVFAAFEKEMIALKAACERRAPADTAKH